MVDIASTKQPSFNMEPCESLYQSPNDTSTIAGIPTHLDKAPVSEQTLTDQAVDDSLHDRFTVEHDAQPIQEEETGTAEPTQLISREILEQAFHMRTGDKTVLRGSVHDEMAPMEERRMSGLPVSSEEEAVLGVRLPHFSSLGSEFDTEKRVVKESRERKRKRDIAQEGASPGSSKKNRSPDSVAPSIHEGTTYNNKQQLSLLRQYYANNPTPSSAECAELSRVTGRPVGKVKEYFRQRRNKLRGIDGSALDEMEEPGRAISWLHMSYRAASHNSVIPQLQIYAAYQARFDAFHRVSPMLGGQDLISLACATFVDCSLARDPEGDWILRGLDQREGGNKAREIITKMEREGKGNGDRSSDRTGFPDLEDYLVSMPEPIRASTWLLNNYRQNQKSEVHDEARFSTPSLAQVDLYASYATRFADTTRQNVEGDSEVQDGDTVEDRGVIDRDDEAEDAEPAEHNTSERSYVATQSREKVIKSEPGRLLNPLELINLVKIAFPGSVAVLDEAGHFVIIGIERRKGVVSHLIPGQDYDECRKLIDPSETKGKYKVPPPTAIRDMFPFGILDVNPSSSAHSFASVIKNKLRFLNSHDGAQLEREGPTEPASRQKYTDTEQFEAIVKENPTHAQQGDQEHRVTLPAADRELVDGLKRFKHSRLGQEIRDVCVQQ